MISNSLLINIAMFDILSSDGICQKCELNNYFQREVQLEVPENISPAM